MVLHSFEILYQREIKMKEQALNMVVFNVIPSGLEAPLSYQALHTFLHRQLYFKAETQQEKYWITAKRFSVHHNSWFNPHIILSSLTAVAEACLTRGWILPILSMIKENWTSELIHLLLENLPQSTWKIGRFKIHLERDTIFSDDPKALFTHKYTCRTALSKEAWRLTCLLTLFASTHDEINNTAVYQYINSLLLVQTAIILYCLLGIATDATFTGTLHTCYVEPTSGHIRNPISNAEDAINQHHQMLSLVWHNSAVTLFIQGTDPGILCNTVFLPLVLPQFQLNYTDEFVQQNRNILDLHM